MTALLQSIMKPEAFYQVEPWEPRFMDHDWVCLNEAGPGVDVGTEIHECKRCAQQKWVWEQNVPCGTVTKERYAPSYGVCVRRE